MLFARAAELTGVQLAEADTTYTAPPRVRRGILREGALVIRGNTSERYQEIAIAAEQLAGPAFINQTGTLVERIAKAVEICREASWMSRAAVDELERLHNAARVAELLKSKPR